MNDNNFNEPVNNGTDIPEINENGNAVEEKASAAETVQFNADGSYRSGYLGKESDKTDTNASEAVKNEAPSYQTAERKENVNPYSYGTSNQGNNNSYPYGNGANYSQNNNQRSSYPYTNQSNYPYGGNPYSQNSYNQGNPYKAPSQQGYAYPADNDGKKNGKSKGAKIFAIVAGVLCVFLVFALIAVVAGDKTPTTSGDESTTQGVVGEAEEFVTNSSPITGDEINADGELTPKNIYNKVLPSSVGILVYDKTKTLASEGSGVLFQESSDGKFTYIVTCAHVISDSSGYIRVQVYDGKEYDAEVVGFDARTDIGVIRIEETGFTLAEIGDSSKIFVGDPIYAIGNPGGVEFANSFTNGIVSALDRPVNSSATGYTTECIQHTAAINPGNSGGALVNAFGQVIGINSMKIVADEYEGMGFAVPSSVFVEIVNEILQHGYVSNRPKLGITYVAASEYSTYGMFVAIKGLPSGSIVIYEIASDSALAETKAQEGDMIVAVNGVNLDNASYLSEIIEDSNVGDTLTLSLIRIHEDYSYDEFDVTVTLVEDRGDTFITEEEEETLPDNYSGGSYEDYFEKYFEDYFGSYFGGGYNP